MIDTPNLDTISIPTPTAAPVLNQPSEAMPAARRAHHLVRKIVRWLISAGIYFWTIYSLLVHNNILQSILFALIFFIVFHFTYLELYQTKRRYVLWGLLLLSAIEFLIFSQATLLMRWAILGINAAIYMLAKALQGESHDKISFDGRGYFTVGGYMFTVFITIAYSLVVMGMYDVFPFSCTDLSRMSQQVIDVATKPLELWVNEVSNMKASTDKFFSSKVKDVVDIGKMIDIAPSKPGNNSMLASLDAYKKTLIDQAIANNKEINTGICDYLITYIQKIYNNPAFVTSVVVSLFLLLYGFIRVVVWVMSGIGYLLFQLMYLVGVYHTKKVMEEVERLE